MTNANHRQNGLLFKISDETFKKIYNRRRLALLDAYSPICRRRAQTRLDHIFWVAKRRKLVLQRTA